MPRPSRHPLHLYLAYREAGVTVVDTAAALRVSVPLVNAKYARARALGILPPIPRVHLLTPKERAAALARAIAKHSKLVPEGADLDEMLAALAQADAKFKEF